MKPGLATTPQQPGVSEYRGGNKQRLRGILYENSWKDLTHLFNPEDRVPGGGVE